MKLKDDPIDAQDPKLFLDTQDDFNLEIWQHRKISEGYVSGTIRYEVLKGAKFRCELCGISAEIKALEVDHIVPRNQRWK